MLSQYMRKIMRVATASFLPQHLYHADRFLSLWQACRRSGGHKVVRICAKMNFDWLRCHINPQSSVELR